jgi:hypothetical protein
MKELDVVKLIKEYKGLPINTEGTIVYKYNNEDAEVEFFDSKGNTITVLTVPLILLDVVIPYDNIR